MLGSEGMDGRVHVGGVGGWEMGWWWLLRIQSQCLEALEQAPLKVAQ